MVGAMNMRERMKGVCIIAIVVTVGCYTYPPTLAWIIVACCADEYFHLVSQLLTNLQTYSPPLSEAEATATSARSSPAHRSAQIDQRQRWSFVCACVIICISALVSHQVLTCTTLAISFLMVTYLLFRHVEDPAVTVPVTSKAKGTSETKTHEQVPSSSSPPESLLLFPSHLSSAHAFLSVLASVFGLWYAGWLFSHAALVIDHPSLPGGGVRRLMYVICTTAGGENGGLFLGGVLGRWKLTPRISPNKSREGALAQLLAAVCVSVAFAACVDVGFGIVSSSVLGFLLGVGGTIGDLFESFLKRSVGVKDAGRIIPGAGGMLDRMDGLIVNFPIVYYYLEYVYGR